MWTVYVATGGNDKEKAVRKAGEFPTKRLAHSAALSERGPDHSAIVRIGHTYTVRPSK